jgi:excisionase family DNA binding protein
MPELSVSVLATIKKKRLSFEQAATRIGVSRPTIWRWATDGIDGQVLPSFKLGGRRFVLLSDLEAFVSAALEGRSAS